MNIYICDFREGDEEEEDNEDVEEGLKPKLTFNPHLQKLYQV